MGKIDPLNKTQKELLKKDRYYRKWEITGELFPILTWIYLFIKITRKHILYQQANKLV
jgi:hypothetical protein